MYGASAMWQRLADKWPSEFDVHQKNWRTEGIVAGALSVRDPNRNSNGLRFYLSLLMVLLYASDKQDEELYHRIPNRNLGDPYAVKFFGTQIDMDYYQSVQEYKTIATHVSLGGATVLEIGAGYGRLAHSILSLEPNLERYILVDLPTTLGVAQRYLAAVLPAEVFRKVSFFSALDNFSQFEIDVDLAININSMNEMDSGVVAAYLSWIDRHASHFYVNNPVGKFLFPSNLNPNDEVVRAALAAGPISDIFDLWDDQVIEERIPLFVNAYRPSDRWFPLYTGRASPWIYYGVALYGKK
jgi:hypothetical protein